MRLFITWLDYALELGKRSHSSILIGFDSIGDFRERTKVEEQQTTDTETI